MSHSDPSSLQQQEAGQRRNLPPAPEAVAEIPARPLNPTRYGDWEKNGRCVDF